MTDPGFPSRDRPLGAAFSTKVARNERPAPHGRMPWPLAAATIVVLSLSAWLAVIYVVHRLIWG